MAAGVRIGCSGWQYQSWREVFYPPRTAQPRWLSHYASVFDTVEVNSTFYRLAKREAVARWVTQVPPGFLFTIKSSQYLTHMKRLLDMEQGVERLYEPLQPLVEAGRLGPVLWQLPPNFRRDDERLDAWLDALRRFGPLRHAVEFRHESWFDPAVYGILHAHGAGFVIGDDPRRVDWPQVVTAEWSFVRFHFGRRGRRGNYAESELREWAARVRDLATHGDVLAYFNNDWEGFAVANGKRLRSLLDA